MRLMRNARFIGYNPNESLAAKCARSPIARPRVRSYC
jgi:hypothetical protein